MRGNESLGDTIDFLRNKEDAVKAPMPTRSHAKCRRKSRYCGEFHTSALIMIGIVMSILSASNTSPSHDVLPLECGGNTTSKWDYVQSESTRFVSYAIQCAFLTSCMELHGW